MKHAPITVAVISLFLILAVSACGRSKAASSEEAIAEVKTMETVEEKADYLVKQAKAFYSSEQYRDAVESAQYVLKNLDKDSEEAREILAKAQKEMGSAVEGVVKDVTKGIRNLGK